MKTLSLAASAQLAKETGVEPVILVQIEIPNNFVYVSDKEITRLGINWLGKIQTFGDITSEKRTDLVGAISSVEITLDDSDEAYRNRLNTERWSARKVKVFHSFGESDETFLVFVGKVSTPFAWREEDHSISFEAVSDFTSQPAGLEILNDTFSGGVNGGYVPLAFGTVVNACPVQIYENISANVATPFFRVDELRAIPETSVYPYGTWAQSPYQAQYGNYLYRINGQYIVVQTTYTPTFDVDDASKFPQDTIINLSASNFVGRIIGSFHGNTFTVTKLDDLIKTLGPNDITEQNANGIRPSYVKVLDAFDYTWTNFVFKTKNANNEDVNTTLNVLSQDDHKVYLSDDPPEKWSSIEVRVPQFAPNTQLITPVKTTVIQIGNKIYLDDDGIIAAYAISAIPFTNLKVLGYQVFNGKKNLREIPDTFYDIDTNFKGLGITAIVIHKPFSAYKIELQDKNFNLTWEDKFYVSFESSVGSNVSDIIKYIVQHYTNYEADFATFEAVKNKVAKYPANFVVKTAPDALQLLSDICYQARCSITISNGIVYLKYLSSEPDVVAQITDAEIDEASVVISYTDESLLRTQLVGKYDVDCLNHIERKITYQNNIDIYGLIKEEKNYTIYNVDSLIRKSNTFWGNRISNQWKLIALKTVLTSLAIDQGDCIYVRSTLYTGKAIVDGVSYSNTGLEITYTLWTPVIVGTDVQSPLAWSIDSADVAPLSPVITGQAADIYSVTYPISDYGVHDANTVAVNLTSDENNDGLATFVTPDGVTGVAMNLNPETKAKAGDAAIVTKSKYGSYAFQAPGGGGGALHLGGEQATQVDDGSTDAPIPAGALSDVFQIVNNTLVLDLDKIQVIGFDALEAVPLSDLFIIVNGKLCLKTDANMSDGTDVAPQELVLDSAVTPSKFRPATSFVNT